MVNKKKCFLIILAIYILIALIISGCSKPSPPQITLSEESCYYGEVTPDERPTHDFIIKNEGGEKLIIESVYSSCPCAILDLVENEILPGKETLLKTTFDPTGYEGEVNKLITLKSNDPKNPEIVIETSINVLQVPSPDLQLSEQTFDLGTFNENNLPVIDFTISNSGGADLIIQEIIAENIFNHNLKIPLTISPAKQFEAQLTINSDLLTAGDFRKSIRINSNDPKKSMVFLRLMGSFIN